MSQGNDEQRLRQEIQDTLVRAFGGIAYARLTDMERRRVGRAGDDLFEILRANGLQPEPSAMRHVHYPPQHIAERNLVSFWRHDYPALFAEPEPYVVALAPHLTEWLDARAPGWSVTLNRGDHGDGEPQAVLTLAYRRQALALIEQFGPRDVQVAKVLADDGRIQEAAPGVSAHAATG